MITLTFKNLKTGKLFDLVFDDFKKAKNRLIRAAYSDKIKCLGYCSDTLSHDVLKEFNKWIK